MTTYLYTLNTLSDWEIGYLTAETNSGRFFKKSSRPVQLVKLGSTPNPIQTMGGIEIVPDKTIDTVQFESGDILILPGADTWSEPGNEAVINMIPELLDKGVTVAAICGATVALAKAGVLNRRKHTSNDKGFLEMTCPDYAGGDHYLDELAVTDGNLITATGLAPLEFSVEVFKKMGVMTPETLEAWYQLNETKDGQYFGVLMDSLG